MTAVCHMQPARRQGLRLGDGLMLAGLVLAATALTLALQAPQIAATLAGRFTDPDDAMRLVEARAWLAGQSWFDMDATRLDPPAGSFMHWSRLVDLPLAGFIRLFGLFMDTEHAERLACVAVPVLWLVALYAGVARLADLLVGRGGRLAIVLGLLFCGATLIQFAPGRVGHHAPETVALVFALGCALAALDPRRAREAFVSGALVALSLAMSLETLPYDAVLVGTLVVLGIWKGEALKATLAWFGTGLVVALPLLFLVTVGPDRWTAPVCDAYSAAHLGAGMIGGCGLLLLAAIANRPRLVRVGTAAGIGIAILAFLVLAYPSCLRSPFAAVDPLVRELWLAHVVESLSLPRFAARWPMLTVAIAAPVALGLVGSLVAVRAERGVTQLRFGLVTTMIAAGLALAFWQMRVLTSVGPIALCGGVYLVAVLREKLAERGARLAVLAPAGILAFASTMWLLFLPADAASPKAQQAAAKKSACLAPEALAPLATLPAGTVVGPMDSGAHILAAAPRLAVFAAPYHRNDDGNRYAFDVFLAAPDVARNMLAARRATYVVTCPDMSDITRLAARAPDGLAAKLQAGNVPPFLARVPLPGTPYEVYAVRR